MRSGESKDSSDGAGGAPRPELLLLPPQPIQARAGVFAVVTLAASIAAGLLIFGGKPANFAPVPSGGLPGSHHTVITLNVDQAPGAFKILPSSFQNSPASVLAQLNMPEAEKRRLSEKLADGSVRLAAVTLWDRLDEDGDQIEVNAATFSQMLTIMHKPVTFFLPVQPGGTVSIRAVRDGGGGGVTLGVSTIIGPVPLPALVPGQVVEIPAL
jgi:hypothetical protein